MNLQEKHSLTLPRAESVFAGSNGVVTRKYLKELSRQAPLGETAANLFRAQKTSERAKQYRGGPDHGWDSYSDLSYNRKGEALKRLSGSLCEADLLPFGWKFDDEQYMWVLYVDLPTGQVSFHSHERYDGADYQADWDGSGESRNRIIAFCDSIV